MGDELGELPADELRAREAEEPSRGEVDLPDAAGGVHGEVADGGEVEQLGVPPERGLERAPGRPQLLVLQLELDLVHLELVDQAASVGSLRLGGRRASDSRASAFRRSSPVCGRLVVTRTSSPRPSATLARRARSRRLRSSMSVWIPYHRVTAPARRRWGPRGYGTSGTFHLSRGIRRSSASGEAAFTAPRHASRSRSRSSACTCSSQPYPSCSASADPRVLDPLPAQVIASTVRAGRPDQRGEGLRHLLQLAGLLAQPLLQPPRRARVGERDAPRRRSRSRASGTA